MVFTKRLRDGVRRGEITCSVRIWQRPRVKAGSRYRMEEGEIEVDSIQPIGFPDITPELARESGFLDTLKGHYPNIKIISADQHAGATRETAYQVSQNLLNRYGHEVNGIFCPCEPPTIAMTKALRDIGLAEERGEGGGEHGGGPWT